MKTSVSLAVVSVCCSSIALAQTERDLDSHVHGAANLNVAVIASEVQLELSTPWNNLVGFEHAPSTDEQHALVDEALELLNNPDELFSFNNANCSTTEVLVENTMGAHEDGHDDHEDEHGHDDEHDDKHAHKDEHGHDDEHDDDHAHKDEHGHDDEHDDDHAHKDEHGHDDEHDDEHAHKDEHGHDDEHGESESAHSAVLALYTYQCEGVDQLDTIDLSLFERWSSLVDLDVQLVGDNGQTMLELNRDNASIDVSQVR